MAAFPGLVAAYGFEEGSGATVTDQSGNGNTGTISGATWTTAGRFGNALSFDGVNDWVTVNDAPSLDLTTGMTLEAWLYPTAGGGWRTAVMKEQSGHLAYALDASSSTNQPRGEVFTTSDFGAVGPAALPLNTWTHLATTYDGATLRLYVNSALVSSTAVSGTIVTSGQPLRIGGNAVWGEYFAGLIDEIRIYNRALSQAEIQSDMDTSISAPGFQIDAYNDSLTLGPSDLGTYNMLISPINGFTGSVLCGVSGLPADATGIFEPPGGPPHPGPFALTIGTGPTTTPGTYQPMVTCINGSLTATKTLTLIVTSGPDFRVVVEPNSLILTQGENGVANFQIQPMSGYAQLVTMTASGLPSGVSTAFTPSALVPPGQGTVQFTIGANTPPGVYPLLITATDGTLTRQAAFELTVLLQNASGSWRQQALGDTGALFYGAIVGDVGNIGKNRVYASGGSGLMYEYSFDGSSWSFSRMPVGVPTDDEMHNMAIGPGRNDGVNRLYIAVSGGNRLYELSWVNGSWQVALVANLSGATDVSIGDGRNDGRMRVYVSWMSGTTEFTWTGSAWQQVTMSSNEGGWVHGIDLRPGRSDGVNRIYTANQGNGAVYEYTWSGSSWTKLLIDGSVTDTRNIELGDGRNDGRLRAYTAAGDGNVYEYTWTGSAWQRVSLGNAGAAGVKVHSIPARAKGDNLVRIYAAAANGGVYEYAWTGSAWETVGLGSATAYMYGLETGDGLNKGTIQIYGSSYDGNAYLFEWIPAGPPALDTSITGRPLNPSTSNSASFTFISTVAGSSFQCQLDASSFVACASPQSYSGLANGSHTFQVRAMDQAGTVDPTPASYTWTVDTQPPVISSLIASPGTGGTATITWSTTNEASDSRVDYGTSPSSLALSATNATLVTSHSITLTGLTPNTTYYYRVTSKDAATNSSTSPPVGSSPASFTTPAVTTVTAFPSSIVILSGTPRGGSAASLNGDEDSYYEVNSTTSGTRTTSWYAVFPGVPNALSNLKITYKGKNSQSCTQTVSIRRWTTSSWVQLDSRSVGTTEVLIADLIPSGTLADYVSGSSGDGELRVRVRCTRSSPSFFSSGDLLRIVYDRP
jgi:hypothetical protein